MTGSEFSDQFDVQYNNITSNQAPGLDEYEKAVFLTKAQDELVKNYFLPQSNPKQAGFDGNQKRQMDFSLLMRSDACTELTIPAGNSQATIYQYRFDPRSTLYIMPKDLFIPINESLQFSTTSSSAQEPYTLVFQRQVVPLSYEEYLLKMSKPYKEPLKNQAWRLLVNNAGETDPDGATTSHDGQKLAEIIAGHNDIAWSKETGHNMRYIIRYIRKPKPIILAPLTGVTLGGYTGAGENDPYILSTDQLSIVNPCELDESLHEEILQRAVELAKVAWTATGQENVNLVMQAGQRSE